ANRICDGIVQLPFLITRQRRKAPRLVNSANGVFIFRFKVCVFRLRLSLASRVLRGQQCNPAAGKNRPRFFLMPPDHTGHIQI
ncbi:MULTISPECIES: hypothetical protein, partial [unclassified Citrobacter]|uniref:hypothetical protein n=1 Tax=unclassified Citrobacter TaxID=2644389 RepID=UPI002577A995